MKRRDEFVPVECLAVPWKQAVMPNGEPKGIQYKSIWSGGDGLPQVSFNRYEPQWTEPRHRHVEDEVLMLIEGEIDVAGTVYRAPAVVFVGRGTLYGPLTAGPEGVSFYRVAYTEAMIKRNSADEALAVENA